MRRLLVAHPGPAYFALAWAFSWAVMVPLALAKHGFLPPLPGWLHYLSAYGPLLAAAAVIAPTEGAPGLRAWGARLARGTTAPGPLLVALSPVLAWAALALAGPLLPRALPSAGALGRVNFLPELGALALPMWLLNSGLGEEAGWRGYALPLLQRRLGPRTASALIACAWMAWHVPAFFYLPSYEGFGPGMAAGFFVGVLTGSFLLTWIANRSGGTLLPIAWHGLFNWTTAPPASAALLAPVVSTAVTVLGVVAAWRLKREAPATR